LSLLPFPGPDRGGDDERRSAVVGYGGLWLMMDEAHVTSVAVRPAFRGRGLGELLMLSLFGMALRLNARYVTLEVRVSNSVARALYQKLGFRQTGIRPRYYTDNNEDAVIMSSELLSSAAFRERYAATERSLAARLSWTSAV
jgi:ribosomal-protein-alanine N-acetyltransferase